MSINRSRSCSIEGCAKPVQARGWCTTHWGRWHRTGDPEKLVDKPPPLYVNPEAKPGMCAVPDCGRPIRARGVCATHHQRWRDTGDVNAAEPVRISGDDEARFWTNVDKRGPDECWPWTGHIDKTGYGRFSGSESLAHRWSHKHFVGPAAPSQHVDHVCHNRDKTCPRGPRCLHRRCVNPAHLEAVAPEVNAFRANGSSYESCVEGHPRTPENVTINSTTGGVQCRLCKPRYERNARARRRQKPT